MVFEQKKNRQKDKKLSTNHYLGATWNWKTVSVHERRFDIITVEMEMSVHERRSDIITVVLTPFKLILRYMFQSDLHMSTLIRICCQLESCINIWGVLIY